MSAKSDKPAKKIGKFFLDIRSELKKVIWPDRKKLVQSTVTVLAMCAIFAAVIFLIDTVLSKSLTAINFFNEKSTLTSSQSTTTSSLPAATVTPTESSEDEKSDPADSTAGTSGAAASENKDDKPEASEASQD